MTADRFGAARRIVLAFFLPLAACADSASDSAGAAMAGTPPSGVEVAARNDGPARVVVHGVDLTGIGYDLGRPTAPVVMVEFSDFGCPYCAQYARESFPSIYTEYVETGQVFYKMVPFVMGMFPNGDRAARAAECAAEQGQFWPVHDSVYARQRDWKRGNEPDAVLRQAAAPLVKDEAAWRRCYSTGATDARTEAATDRATRLGVRATPTFFIQGRAIEGALPLPALRQTLAELLAAARPATR